MQSIGYYVEGPTKSIVGQLLAKLNLFLGSSSNRMVKNMPDKSIRFTRWLIVLVFLFAFVLNNIWQGGDNLWAYWISRFLVGGEFAVFGLAFLFFPKFMMKVCTKYPEDLIGIPDWKFKVIGLIAGIPISIMGIWFFSIGIRRWLLEGCYLIDCLLSVP